MGLSGPAAGLAPRYNVAPGQAVAAARADDRGRRQLHMLRWGLIPSWSRLPAGSTWLTGFRPINARLETAAAKPMFRSAFRTRRCLIPADGYYEWTGRSGSRQPYLISRADGGVMVFAGLWERWRVPARLFFSLHVVYRHPNFY